MAGKGQRIGALRWDIVADNSQLVTKIKASNRMTKDLSRAMKATRTPMERYTKGLLDARAAIKRGAIDGKAYRYELLRLQKQLGREQAALDSNTRAVNKNTRAKVLNRKATRSGFGKGAANMLGSGLSGVGAGGVGAGLGRTIGLGAGSPGGALAAYGFANLAIMIKAGKEFAKLESDVTELQVFMGKKDGKKYAEEFRSIARSSSLTTSQLVKNAAVIKSYGVELDNIVDFTERLGEASGGDSAQFNNMTKAFAQVNALGKLMGQEKNQLVNAGFSLKLIAREVGIPMEQFAAHMEAGLITAQHVNDALVTATNEGGLFYGRLQAKAETLAGKWDIFINSSNEMFAMLGQSKQGWMKDTIDSLTKSINTLAESLDRKKKMEDLKTEEEYYRNAVNPTAKSKYGGSFATHNADGSVASNGMFGNAQGKQYGMSRGDNSWGSALFSGWSAWWANEATLGDIFSLDEQARVLQSKARYAQQLEATARAKKKANDAGFFKPEEIEEAFDDANIIDVITPDKGKGGKTGAALSTFSANSMEEYNFLRDKHTADRDLAMKSLDTLKIIASNTSDEAGTEGRKGWRRRAQEGLDLKAANAKELGTWAFAAGNWLGNGGRTDSQVRADQAFDMFGDPTGGTYENDRYRNMKAIREKYAVNGLLDPMRSPSGEWLGDSIGYSKFGSTIKSGSQEDLFREEYEQMKVELKAEYKHKKRQDERREELAAIKQGVDKQESIKGILGSMLKHMQDEAKTLNQEAL